MIPLDDIQRAAARIAGRVRRTPLMRAEALKHAPARAGRELWLKLECLQVSGSFKARGALSKLAALAPEAMAQGVVTASGGNHGLALAYAGHAAGVPVTVFLPESVTAAKIRKLKTWGATAIVTGRVWDDAREAALAHAQARGLAFVHPFADPLVVAGQGTLGLEILDQLPEFEVAVIAIGGGGLMAGVASAIRALRPGVRFIGVEPEGAAALHDSLAAGRLVTLDDITSRIATLSARSSEPLNFEIIRECVEEIVLIRDEDALEAARWLWFEMGIAADLSGSAALAAILTGKVAISADERVVALVCGAGSDALIASP